MKIVYLYPKTSFLSSYDSDFLFGYFLSIMRYFYGEEYTTSIIDKFESSEPPFLLSNCFFFNNLENNKKELLLPKPLLGGKLQEVDSIKKYKKIKQYKGQKYINYDIFSKLISGNITDSDLFTEFTNSENTTKSKLTKKEVSTPHVQINRITNSSEEGHFFHTEDIYVYNGGLFFFYKGDISIIEPVLRFINHYGMGADTSLGKGHFKVEYDDFSFPEVDAPNCYINLSSYYPTLDEIEHYRKNPNTFFYEIDQKQGKINTSLLGGEKFQKRKINFFAPGSVLPLISGRQYLGCLQDVEEIGDIKIKFNGYALVVPAKIKVD